MILGDGLKFGPRTGKGTSVTVNDLGAPRALIADDQPDVLAALHLLLKGAGYETHGATSPSTLIKELESRKFDLLLMDLNYTRDTTSGQEGLELLTRIKAMDETLPIVVMTGWGSIDLAVDAMRRGVSDFVQKPWENSRLLSILRTQIENGQAVRKLRGYSSGAEVAEAEDIQRRLMPKEIAQIPGYGIAAAWQPARGVGGDYFDVLKLDEGRMALCIGDVVGKGLPAALLMSNLQGAVKAFSSERMSPRELCRRVNEVVCSNTVSSRFISFFYCLLDGERKKLWYTNAGHPAPILIHTDGTCSRLDHGGAVLGVFPEWNYEEGEIALESGQYLLLFTDGISEARNDLGEEFGDERLAVMVAENRHLPAAALQKKVMSRVEQFCKGMLEDDATAIVLSVQ